MALELATNATLLGDAACEQEQSLVAALDGWAPGAPALDGRLGRIALEENSRRRRVALWNLLAEQERDGRQRLLEGVIAAAYREDAAGLRLLFSFLCGRPATYLHPERIASRRHLDRFERRLSLYSPPRDDAEMEWLEEVHTILPDGRRDDLAGHRETIMDLLGGKEEFPHPLPEPLGELIRLEGRAASLRGARLVDKVGDYDPLALARLLPVVVALDEWQGDLDALVTHGPVALKHPLEQFLGEEELNSWRRQLAKAEDAPGRILSGWVHWMNGTEMVGNEPAAWVSLLRTLGERRYRKTLYAAQLMPLRWRSRRLGLPSRPPAELFKRRAVTQSDGLFWVDLDELLWAEWVSPDGRPMSAEGWSREESPLALLRSRVQDDAFCDGILSNEQWNQRPGVVEAIARGSRSLKILLRIARERRLHTGACNRGVALALLENPTNVPLSALRPFIGPRYLSRHDFTRLARGGAGIRQDICREAREVMRRV